MNLVLLSVVLHTFLGWRLLPALSVWPLVQALVLLWLLASMMLVPLGMAAWRIRRQPLSDRVAWTGMLFMGLFSSLFVLTLLREAALLLARLASHLDAGWLPSGSPSLVSLQQDGALGVVLLALVITALGFFNARRTATVVGVDIPIVDLPPALEGFTIAQISDVHVGPTIKRDYLRAIVLKVNGMKADMVAVTGDLVDGSVKALAPHVAPLAELSSTHGTYFVTGNHEYYCGAHAWIGELQRLGIRVLMNEHVVLQHRQSPVVVAGVTDFTAHHFDPAHRSDPEAALKGAPPHAMKLLLAHQPRSADAAARAGFQLQLSGHTHGGQFLPWTYFVRLQQPFTAGLHRLKDMWVYTSRGTGYWGPPKRFGAPSEITRIRLVNAGR